MLVYDPMKVAKAPDNYMDILDSNEHIIGTIKKDGYWSQLIKEENQVYLFSRTKSKKTGFYSDNIEKVPFLKEWAMNNLPNGTCIIGEMYYPGGTSKNVTSILGALPEKAIDRQENGGFGRLHFYMHDILRFNGEDYVVNQVDYSHRYSNLCRHIDIGTELIKETEVASCVDNFYCDLNKSIDRALAAGEEGMVLRYEDGLYLPGKRTPSVMFKVKESTDELDFVITNLLEPEKVYTGKNPESWRYWLTSNGDKVDLSIEKDRLLVEPITQDYYRGWKNALEIGAYDNAGNLITTGRVASGLSDAVKEDMTCNPDKYIGKVCRIRAMSVDKKALSARHPYYLGLHESKDAADCKISEIFG